MEAVSFCGAAQRSRKR